MRLFDPPPPRAKRPFRCAVIVGAPGMGKTSLAEEWIAAWMKERQGRGVLAILDPAKQFRHLPGASWPGEGDPDDDRAPEARAAAWIAALKRSRAQEGRDPPPCLVVLDDADVYMSSSAPRGVWRDFLMTFRHWRCDVLLIARRTQEIPKVATQNAAQIAIFATREPYAADYLARWLGPEIVRQIPREPHRYLLVDVYSGLAREGRTRRRAHTTAADRA
jgi:hypothetical protein